MSSEVVDSAQRMSDSTSSGFRALNLIVSRTHSHRYVEENKTRIFRAGIPSRG